MHTEPTTVEVSRRHTSTGIRITTYRHTTMGGRVSDTYRVTAPCMAANGVQCDNTDHLDTLLRMPLAELLTLLA